MRAARIHSVDAAPVLEDIPPEPTKSGSVAVSIVAASLNPVDLVIASGNFYAGHPPFPYVPAIEGTGHLEDETPVYVTGEGFGVARNGLLQERVIVDAETPIRLPEGVDLNVAAALGTAGLAGWLAVRWRGELQPGERVLVLGATGTAGSVAVQAARLGGASYIVAAGRNEQRLADLSDISDAQVDLDAPDAAQELLEACDPGVDIVFDPLWSAPLQWALEATKRGARIVHVGASAGTQSTLSSTEVRGKQLSLLGYSNFAVPPEVSTNAYLQLVRHSIDRSIRVAVNVSSIDDIDAAWQLLRSGGGKQVVRLSGATK